MSDAPEKIWIEFFKWNNSIGDAYAKNTPHGIEYILKSSADKKTGDIFGKTYNEAYSKGYEFAKKEADKREQALRDRIKELEKEVKIFHKLDDEESETEADAFRESID